MKRLSRVQLALALLIGIVGAGCLITAGDASLNPGRPTPDTTRQSAVLDQRIVVLEVAGASGKPSIAESQATALAASSLATSSHATSVRARYARITLRNEDGGVAWGIQSRPAWLVTFQDVGYPLASATAADCSCSAYYWRPHTVVALDATSGEVLVRMGVAT